MSKKEVYFSLGSNVGDKVGNIEAALRKMEEIFETAIKKKSDFYVTAPWGFKTATEDFINICVMFEIDDEGICPQEKCSDILKKCKQIEENTGRKEIYEEDENGDRIYHDREIDIDILLYGNSRFSNDKITVPHKLMRQRDFVMIPLKTIVDERVVSLFPEIFK